MFNNIAQLALCISSNLVEIELRKRFITYLFLISVGKNPEVLDKLSPGIIDVVRYNLYLKQKNKNLKIVRQVKNVIQLLIDVENLYLRQKKIVDLVKNVIQLLIDVENLYLRQKNLMIVQNNLFKIV